MKPQTKEFKKLLPIHLSNRPMRQNIAVATHTAIQKRDEAVREVPDWEELRMQAYEIKREIIDHLYECLSRFERKAREHGITVFRADNGLEANEIAEQIAREYGVKVIVKSKSMVTEEIGFNEYMISRGYEVLETDLGEFIVQLAGERPSNLITPAMHKSLKDIARLFSAKLHIPYSEDPQFLTETARNLLREKFLKADMGVSGANFAIVENGGIAVVENEGNARMCMSVPRTHVAFIGMERLIPEVEDLALFLTLLCRSGTGQKITSYVSLITGARTPEEYDGPDKVFYIIMDNGRSKFLSDARLKQALYCIRCSACYNICPVYRNIGGHAYGWVYQGPIGSIITPEFIGLREARDLPFASSLCGSCTDICPVKIPLHRLLLYQRKRIVEELKSSLLEKLFIKSFTWMSGSSVRFQPSMAFIRRLVKHFPFLAFIPSWAQSREIPRLAPQSFREWWRKNFPNRVRSERR